MEKALTSPNPLGLIWGSKAIAAELGVSERQAYYGLENGFIPAKKFGRKWCASRVLLREHLEKMLREVAEPTEAG